MLEIEHRFVASRDVLDRIYPKKLIEQRYITFEPNAVRVRLVDSVHGELTVKLGRGVRRHEYNAEMSMKNDIYELLHSAELPSRLITKYRYKITDTDWVIDEYLGSLAGLYIAEAETLDVPELLNGIYSTEITDLFGSYQASTWDVEHIFQFVEDIWHGNTPS